MKVGQKLQDRDVVKQVGWFIVLLPAHKFIRTFNIALYQPIILLYRRVFVRNKKDLVNRPV